MVVPVEMKSGLRKDTSNIINYVNKIPCDA